MLAVGVLVTFSAIPIGMLLFCWRRPEIVVELNNRFLHVMKLDSFGPWTVDETKFFSAVGVVSIMLMDMVAIYLALSGR